MSGKQDIHPYWRPDFKIRSTLPDIKVVRTNFAINLIAIVLMLMAGCLVLQREYQGHSLRRTVETMEQSVQRAEISNQQYLKTSQQFIKLARGIEELQRFFRAPLLAHELLVTLAQLKPEGCVFSQVTFSESIIKATGKSKAAPKINYTIRIIGNVQELTVLTRLKDLLQQSSALNSEDYMMTVTESMQPRNAQTGIIPIRVTITLTPAHNKGGKK